MNLPAGGGGQAASGEPWLIDPSNRLDVQRYLVARGLVADAGLPIEIARADEGNMNLTLRVTTAEGRSLILKQARPWVEKYPHIPAPFARTLVEAAFYSAVQVAPQVASRMPALMHLDANNYVLVLEDVGAAGDFTSIYADATMPTGTLAALLEWLGRLASISVPAERRALFANRAMRALNHEHMFRFPLLDDNGLDLDAITPGLRHAARELAGDRAYGDAVAALGQRYLADGGTLVHGDYFPGSWLKAGDGVRIIDPEFCFLGDPEFDCGILAAHLTMAQCGPAAFAMVSAAADARRLDRTLVAAYAGVEIMRRLIGVAQLPLTGGIDRKRALLRRSRELVVEPHKGFS